MYICNYSTALKFTENETVFSRVKYFLIWGDYNFEKALDKVKLRKYWTDYWYTILWNMAQVAKGNTKFILIFRTYLIIQDFWQEIHIC